MLYHRLSPLLPGTEPRPQNAHSRHQEATDDYWKDGCACVINKDETHDQGTTQREPLLLDCFVRRRHCQSDLRISHRMCTITKIIAAARALPARTSNRVLNGFVNEGRAIPLRSLALSSLSNCVSILRCSRVSTHFNARCAAS